jgi:AcrR family transcriptional regulator
MARTPDLERRQELLDRIVRYLAENGLAQATLRPMAAALDVSINRLVHHFGSKEELLAQALERSIEQHIELQASWAAEVPDMRLVESYRRWWQWMNESESNLATIRLNYEAAALDPKATGLDGEVRADQIGVWRHDAELFLEREGVPKPDALLEASYTKAVFTGLVMDLLATGDRRRLNKTFQMFLDRLQERIDMLRRQAARDSG